MIRAILIFCVALLYLSVTSAVPIREELKVEGGTLHYQVFGKGKPVVIVGGIAGAASDYLLPVARELGKTHRAILVDLRGTGTSRVNVIDSSTVNVRLILEDLEALRKTLKVPSWTVLGHSMGGVIAMMYASNFQSRVSALVLVGSAGINLDFLGYWSQSIHARLSHEDSVKMEEAENLRTRNTEVSNAEVFKVTLAAYVADRKYISEVRSWFPGERYSPTAAEMMWRNIFHINYDAREPLVKFKRPVLQIQGEQDPIQRKTALQIHGTLSSSKMVFLQNCGHFPWLEQGNEFYKALKEFLKSLK